MSRLIDIDELKGCAIIRPTTHEEIEHIRACKNLISHDDIPTAMVRSTAYYNDEWIPVSSGNMPEEKENPVTRDWYVYPVMVRFEEITDIRYYSYGNGHWYHGPGIMDKYVTHWMDIKPYQPKGE